MASVFTVIFLLSVAVSSSLADTPANCTYDDILGNWTFHRASSVHGYNNTINCDGTFEVDDLFHVQLTYPDKALDKYGNEGFWTLIYNQGFEVVLDGRKYFAFSKYTQLDNHTVQSECHTTFNGWSHDLNGNDWACYFGVKDSASITKLSGVKAFKRDDMNRKYVKNPDFIKEINQKTGLWTAVHYPEMETMTYSERLMRSGGVTNQGQHAYAKVAPVTEKDYNAAKDLPESFDWRNKDGANYVSPVRNQGTCGSCYAFGSMAMLEARVRISSNGTMQPVFSTQDVVSCSKYSQGCDGGFPYLIAGNYGQDFGIVEESCFPYQGKDSISCSRERQGCQRYGSTDYYYIGGYYGACNEQRMLLEIVQNGPIAISFEVTADFQAYKKGIYHQVLGVEDRFNPWEITNHVVAIVGYGTENGVKFWTVKNSWGETWGENGFFRIMRGTDELNIESMAVAATPLRP